MSPSLSVPINKMGITRLPDKVRMIELICEKHLEQYQHILSVHCSCCYFQNANLWHFYYETGQSVLMFRKVTLSQYRKSEKSICTLSLAASDPSAYGSGPWTDRSSLWLSLHPTCHSASQYRSQGTSNALNRIYGPFHTIGQMMAHIPIVTFITCISPPVGGVSLVPSGRW